MLRVSRLAPVMLMLFSGLCWSGLAQTGEPQSRPGQDDRYRILANKSATLVDQGDMPALAAHLQSLKADPALDNASKERLLRGTLLALGDLEPDASAVAEVRALTSYQSTARMPWTEHGRTGSFLIADVAAAARFTELRWQETAARKSASDAISGADNAVIELYVGGSASERTGIEEAFAAASPDSLANFVGELDFRLGQGDSVTGIARIAAIATRNSDLLGSVINHSTPEDAVQTIVLLDTQDWGLEALPVLEIGVNRQETASASLLKMGPFASTDPDARRIVLDALGGPHGASAAAALARANETAILDQLATLLNTSGDELTRRHALLGLRLADSDRARTHLRSFVKQADAPPALVAEVPTWLQD